MRDEELAHRYAKALFELSANEIQQKFLEELTLVVELLSVPELKGFYLSPVIQINEKLRLLEETLKVLPISSDMKQFIQLLVVKKRLGIIKKISQKYQELLDQSFGVSRGRIRASRVLRADELTNIEQVISHVTNQSVELEFELDSEIGGGIVAQVGTYMFDDSLTSHLRRLKHNLTKAALILNE